MQSAGNAAKLIVTLEGKPESVVELMDRLTIGRSTNNQLVVDDQKASRSHAEIRHLGGGRYRISDVGSANGTWINGRRLTVPKELEDGDQIMIGSVNIKFVAPSITRTQEVTMSTGTALFMRNELVVVLVADIRNYTGMSEALPNREFSRLISEWFRESSDIIEQNGGIIDKFIGDAVMAYWVASSKTEPGKEVNASLHTARALSNAPTCFQRACRVSFPATLSASVSD
jgi:adenylate cyclase